MEQPVVQGVEQAGAVQPEVRTSDYDAIIKGIIAAGGKKLPGIRVKNANFTEKDNYTMVSFTLANKVRGYVRDEETGVYKEGMTNVILPLCLLSVALSKRMMKKHGLLIIF